MDDHYLVGSDLDGLELRLLAHFMHPYDGGAYARAILEGDIHTYNMEKAGLTTRDQAKTFIYAFIYGASNAKLGSIMGGGEYLGAKAKKTFRAEVPALAMVEKYAKAMVKTKGGLVMLDGRIVPIRKEHAILNTLLQGSGGILSKYWMIITNHRTEHLRRHQLSYSHDELQFSVHRDDTPRFCPIIEASAEEAGKRMKINMPITASSSIGKDWSETH
jgi:DNA polymerase I-like protein with 3'-5' exonuclease and polymerase domains